jgi:hypothetical protein
MRSTLLTSCGAVTLVQPTPNNPIELVIALDVGMVGSTFAYAPAAAAADKPEPLVPYRWEDQPFPDVKTVTALLVSPQDKALAFGNSALALLSDLHEEDQDAGYCLLRQFKLALHTGRTTEDEDGPVVTEQGRPFRAVSLFAAFLAWLKHRALRHLRETGVPIPADNRILWCLTVPGLWSDRAKWWMRRAAQKAGLIRDDPADAARLCLLREAEAAAVYCLQKYAGMRPGDLPAGNRLMVLDAGGATADVTVFEISPQRELVELVAGSGGAHGSTRIDRQFEEYLRRDDGPFGHGVFDRFKQQCPVGHLELLNAWEEAKRTYHPERDRSRVPIPASLYQFLADDCPAALNRLKARQRGRVDALQIDYRTMEGLFEPALEGVTAEVRKQFSKVPGGRVDYLFLTGGFGCSPLLQSRIWREFGSQAGMLIVAQEPLAAVAKGAVWYALEPSRIAARCSRRAYGLRVWEPVRAGDPAATRVTRPDGTWCPTRFCRFVEAGEQVRFNQSVSQVVTPVNPESASIRLEFHAAEQTGVCRTDEPGVAPVGELRIELPPSPTPHHRRVRVTMYFGLGEIAVDAADVESHRKAVAMLRFCTTPS